MSVPPEFELHENPEYILERAALKSLEGLLDAAERDPMFVSRLLNRLIQEGPPYPLSYQILYLIGMVHGLTAGAVVDRKFLTNSWKAAYRESIKEPITQFIGKKRLHGRAPV